MGIIGGYYLVCDNCYQDFTACIEMWKSHFHLDPFTVSTLKYHYLGHEMLL